jgi:hypothetical protein
MNSTDLAAQTWGWEDGKWRLGSRPMTLSAVMRRSGGGGGGGGRPPPALFLFLSFALSYCSRDVSLRMLCSCRCPLFLSLQCSPKGRTSPVSWGFVFSFNI